MQLRYGSNRLLASLPDSDLRCIEPYLESVPLKLGTVLAEPNELHDFVYFPTNGIVSVLTVLPDGRRIDVGIYGRDGAGPLSIALGVGQNPYLYLVQVAGAAWRISIQSFASTLASNSAVRSLALRYLHVFTAQTSFTAMSNSVGSVEERLARWLLMCHDRLEGDDIALTHELISLMLGVRRSGVTSAMHILEGIHIIRNTRAHVRVLDRARLQQTAGAYYGAPEAEYRRLIGPDL